MRILENYDLTTLNTLGISAHAKFFFILEKESDLKDLFLSGCFKDNPKFFLGGGSNVLFPRDFKGIVILNKLKGIEILRENPENVWVRSLGGEIWHDLVNFATKRGYWGIENLSLIPGTVGAAPMQNVGAYGAELKDVFENIEVYDIQSTAKIIFTKEECELGYRDSVFKNKIQVKSSRDISDAVSAIRRSKLPDPAFIPNAGSFFKNVFLQKNKAAKFFKQYPNAPHFEEDEMTKIPAAWLIEQAGWKGKRVGNAGVHEKQALVLVNYGAASGAEIKNLAEQIIASVFAKFGLKLIAEVNLI